MKKATAATAAGLSMIFTAIAMNGAEARPGQAFHGSGGQWHGSTQPWHAAPAPQWHASPPVARQPWPAAPAWHVPAQDPFARQQWQRSQQMQERQRAIQMEIERRRQEQARNQWQHNQVPHNWGQSNSWRGHERGYAGYGNYFRQPSYNPWRFHNDSYGRYGFGVLLGVGIGAALGTEYYLNQPGLPPDGAMPDYFYTPPSPGFLPPGVPQNLLPPGAIPDGDADGVADEDMTPAGQPDPVADADTRRVADACADTTWTSPACVGAMAAANGRLVASYTASLNAAGQARMAQQVAQACAAASGNAVNANPAAASQQCARAFYTAVSRTDIQPDPAYLKLLGASVNCLNDNRPVCDAITPTLRPSGPQ